MHLISTFVNGTSIPICICELPTTVNKALERCSFIRLKNYSEKITNAEKIYANDETFEGVDHIIYARYNERTIEIVEKKTINTGIIFNHYQTTLTILEVITNTDVPRYDGLNQESAVSAEDLNAMRKKEFADEILSKISKRNSNFSS